MPGSKTKTRIPVEHWRAPFLGLRDIPAALDDFELTTFFSYSAAELAVIRSLRKPLHRIGLALHMGFIPMCRAHPGRGGQNPESAVEPPWHPARH